MKNCSKCGDLKSLEDYYSDKRAKDGRESSCKDCSSKHHTDYHLRNLTKSRTRNKNYFNENKDACHATNKVYYENNESTEIRFAGLLAKEVQTGIKVSLSLDEYKILVNPFECIYCDGELPLRGSGLDRKDVKGEYTFDNAVRCCKKCNLSRNVNFSYEEMLSFRPLLLQEKLGPLAIILPRATTHRNQLLDEDIVHKKFNNLKSTAKQRELAIDLSEVEFKDLCNQNCYYCGVETSSKTSSYCLDRMDISKGYTRTNVVPCDKICNSFRNNFRSFESMVMLFGP